MALTNHAVAQLRERPLSSGRAKGDRATAPSCESLRIALVHDWLVSMRGGEKVLDLLCSRFPGAPLYTLLHLPGSVSNTIEARQINTSLLQRLPLSRTKYRQYLPFFPLFAELSKVRDYDVVISSSHAVAKGMVVKGSDARPLHICYIHTPMRYIWDRFDDYFGADKVGALASRYIFKPVAKVLQAYDRRTVDRVDVFIANSRFVADRVRRHYGREAEIVAPPVDVQRYFGTRRSPEAWYLMVSALAPYKRVDQAIAACAAMGRELKIIGSGPEEKKLRALARELNAKVEFLGFVDDSQLGEYYSKAKGLLFPGVEDFGIVPVEAIAAGCPVVAIAEGGVLDSMTAGTAELYSTPTADGLREAMMRFEGRRFSESELRSRAAEFAPECFLSRFDEILERALYEWRDRLPA